MARYEEMNARLGDLHMEKASLQEDSRASDQEIERIRAKKDALEKEVLSCRRRRTPFKKSCAVTTAWKT